MSCPVDRFLLVSSRGPIGERYVTSETTGSRLNKAFLVAVPPGLEAKVRCIWIDPTSPNHLVVEGFGDSLEVDAVDVGRITDVWNEALGEIFNIDKGICTVGKHLPGKLYANIRGPLCKSL